MTDLLLSFIVISCFPRLPAPLTSDKRPSSGFPSHPAITTRIRDTA